MNFPKDNQKLDHIFINGAKPSTGEFDGEYWVNMLTGMIPNFRWAGHRKRFFIKSDTHIGQNLVLLNNSFGYFTVEQGQCEELGGVGVVILNYGNKNNFLTRSVMDKIRKIEPGLYLGRYYKVTDNRVKFNGYFSLNKR